MSMRIRAFKDYPFSRDSIGLHGFDDEARHAVVAIETQEIELYTSYDSPFVRLNDSAAQELMDTLWQCGIRPSEGEGSAGSFAAQKYHLEDMRRLVFKGKK